MTAKKNQQGSVLIISMVMLFLLTLIAISAIQTTTGLLQIVGNAQFREEAIGAGQQTIDRLIGSISASTTGGIVSRANELNSGTNGCADITGDGTCDYAVRLDPLPVCLSLEDASVYVGNQIVIEGNAAISFQAEATAANLAGDTAAEAVALAKKDEARARRNDLGTCLASSSSPGGQCFWSLWRISAVVSDSFTGAGTTLVQGARVLIGIGDKVNNCS